MRIKLLMLTLLTCFLAGATPGVAQPPPIPGSMGPPGMPGADPIGAQLFPPELIIANAQTIGLTEAQQTHIQSDMLQAQQRFVQLQFQLQRVMGDLVNILKRSHVDESNALAQLDKELALEREMKHAQLGLMIQLKNELTADQQSRLKKLRPQP